MTEIIVFGAGGKMGQALSALITEKDNCKLAAAVDTVNKVTTSSPFYSSLDEVKESADVLIDFSHPSCLESILSYCKSKAMPAILCTTGYSDEQIELIRETSKLLPIFYSRNMSVGINLLIELTKKAYSVLGDSFDIEIIEKHHNKKVDAPSGTALMIADALNEDNNGNFEYIYDRHSVRKKRDKKELGLHAVRGGTIVGEHEVIFAGNSETLSITHSAQSKELFASGAVSAAIFMNGKKAGLYSMSDMI